jgi:hypothetical protein
VLASNTGGTFQFRRLGRDLSGGFLSSHAADIAGMITQLRTGGAGDVSFVAAQWSGQLARRYLVAFAATAIVGFFGFYLLIGVLGFLGRLPAPPVSGTWCIDEKLAWLKEHRDRLQSGVIAVGSSVTWRDLDFSALSEETRRASGGTINAAPCFLSISQTRFLTAFLLDHQPTTHTVFSIVAANDFENCSTTPKEFFDYKIASDFLYGDSSGLWLYYRNFRPISFLRDVRLRPQRKSWEMVFDPFGAGPITTDGPNLHHGFMRPFKPESACFEELRGMANDLQKRGVQFIVATFPVMPKWAEVHDPTGEMRHAFVSNVKDAMFGTGAILVDAATLYCLPTAAFTDPAHLQWPETGRFTRFVWDEAARLGADLPRENTK